jgi:hypothetical protein
MKTERIPLEEDWDDEQMKTFVERVAVMEYPELFSKLRHYNRVCQILQAEREKRMREPKCSCHGEGPSDRLRRG